jgi:crotonobetainyl-CoA:carnitine CoA-transferase CaiB-like acyl-CoA transferase
MYGVTTRRALDGLRVLVIGPGMAAWMTGMVLADCGASVTRIERPGGGRDRVRPGARVWGRCTATLELDLAAPTGRAELLERCRDAHAVVVALSERTTSRLGVDPAALAAVNPELVDVRVRGFGTGGPLSHLPGTEGIVAAVTGRMASTTTSSRPGPVFTPVPIASFGAAMLAVEGLLAARYDVERGGPGRVVETSLLHALTAYDMTSGHGNRTHRAGVTGQVFGVMRVPFMTAPTADGRYIQMCSRQPHHFRNWLHALGLERLLDEPDLAHAPDLYPSEERITEVIDLIRQRMMTKSLDEWMAIFAAQDVGGDPFLRADEFLDHPQCTENGRSVHVTGADGTVTRQIGPLAVVEPAPADGAPPEPPRAAPATPSPHPHLPLAGVTVVECGYFYATPFASTLLAEAGARVIKVEPNGGDPGRRNWTTDYVKAMVGKESVVLDLKSADGLQVMHELVERADVFVHNFRPGTPERLGIGFAQLIERNPRLVYVYGSCFGSRGPWAMKAGFHSSPNAIAGAGVIEAGEGNPPVNRTYADPASALATAACTLIGLHERERTGRGLFLETTMLTSMAYTVSEWSTRVAGADTRVVDHRQLGFGRHHRLYRAADGWIYLECADARQRAACDDLLGGDAEAAVAARSADALVAELTAAGVPAVRADGAAHADFMLHDPHCLAVGVAVDASQPGLPTYRRAGAAIRFAGRDATPAPSPALGAHTAAILAELGRSPAEIAELERRGVTRAVGHGLPA